MINFQNDIQVYTEAGVCLTPFGLDLPAQMDLIKSEETAIQNHTDKRLDEADFYGAIIDDKVLEKIFSQTNINGDFTRLEKMMICCLQKIVDTYKPYLNDDFGVIVSSTKGNIDALSHTPNEAYYLSNLAQKITKACGLKTNPIVLSNACVSGIMAVSVAKRLIQAGRYNHCIVIGGDLFSKFVYSGFQSFNAVSANPCKPYDKNRDGISLGEAAAAMFISKDKTVFDNRKRYRIAGDGSINDANHISGPSRTGEGLYQSIRNAQKEAQTASSAIDMISAHGTATIYNDEMEAQAFHRLKLQNTPVFSLKSIFGHTLGAAGLLETVFSLAFADQNLIPPSLGYCQSGLTLPLTINTTVSAKKIACVLKTASGFGGTNTAVIFKKDQLYDA